MHSGVITTVDTIPRTSACQLQLLVGSDSSRLVHMQHGRSTPFDSKVLDWKTSPISSLFSAIINMGEIPDPEESES